MKTLRKLFSPLLAIRPHALAHLMLSLFWVWFSQFGLLAVKYLTDAITTWDTILFWNWVYGYSAMAVIWIVMNPLTRTSRHTIMLRVQKVLYSQYLESFIHLDNNHTETLWTWRSNSILQKWVDKRSSLITITLMDVFSPLWWVVFSVFYFFVFADLERWVWVLCVTLIFFVTTIHGWKITKPLRKKIKGRYTQSDRQIVKIIMSKFEILSQNKRENEKNILEKLINTIRRARIKDSIILIYGLDFWRSLMYWVIILFLIIQWPETLAGVFSIGSFVLLLTRLRGLINETTRLTFTIDDYQQAMIHITKLRETFDDAPTMQWLDNKTKLDIQHGQIIFDNISFGYTKEKILDWLSVMFPHKKKTALVWPSGWWKSTIIKLIAWYIHPNSWEIHIDKQSLSDVDILSYYHHIWYLTQEASVFDGTVRDNLLYGVGTQFFVSNDDERTDENPSLHDIIHKSQCQFIYDLPNWLDTEIGEKWVKLSWWQRQRLAIAKIMLKNPKIILLDEPTSALDSVSEELVTQALNELFKNRTVVIIAHRLQTVKHADTILYIENGKIAEQGTHDELIQKQGKYNTMVEVQTGF